MKRKIFKAAVALALGGCVATSLVACGGSDTDENTVTFYHYAVTSTLNAQLEEKLADFTEQTGIKVKHIGVSKDQYNGTISTRFTSTRNNDMDVLYLDQPLLAQYASSNLLYNINDYIVEDGSGEATVDADNSVGFAFNKSAFNDGAWQTVIYENNVYGVPLTINTSVLFYNVATIMEAGGYATEEEAVSAVNAIKTWDDLKEFASRITGLGSTYALFGGMGSGGYMGWYTQCFVGAAGGKLYDESSKTVLPDDDGTVTSAFEMIKYMFDNSPETVYNSNTGFKGTTSEPAGKVIFSLSHSSDIKDLEVAYTTFGAIPFPGKTEAIGSVSNMGGENLVIPARSEKKEAALKLIKYLVSEDCMSFFQQCTNNFAAVDKYATIDTFTTDASSATYQMYSVVKNQLATAQVRPVVSGWMQVNDNGIPNNLQKYIDGECSVSEAIDAVRAYAAQYLD